MDNCSTWEMLFKGYVIFQLSNSVPNFVKIWFLYKYFLFSNNNNIINITDIYSYYMNINKNIKLKNKELKNIFKKTDNIFDIFVIKGKRGAK